MALRYYKKAPPQKLRGNLKNNSISSTKTINYLDQTISNGVAKLKLMDPLSFIISLIFIIAGLLTLYKQLKPYTLHFIQAKFTNRLNQEIIPLVPESYEVMRATYISDPGETYFKDLLESSKPNTATVKYKGTFYLTIDKIQISDAPVQANVDSSNKEIYQEALSHGLAHFKGTELPTGNGTILVYGHSAAGDYAEENPGDIVTAFTRLFQLQIGDTISIKFENNQYNYAIKKIKEIDPETTNILDNNKGKVLILMTCSPPGLSTKRLIVTAIQQ